MVIKVYVSGISASKEVKKRQQRALMILQSIKIPFESIDITEPGREEDRNFIRESCKNEDGTIAPPPHFFNDNDYCGGFDDFYLATEDDRLPVFLKLENQVSSNEVQINSSDSQNGVSASEKEAAQAGNAPEEEKDTDEAVGDTA